MPLLEGLSYSTEKDVIVLDIGAAYTKCGLAGETSPRCIVPSAVKDKTTGMVVKLWSYSNTDELYEHLKDFLYILCLRHLLVNPKDRRVVVCESIFCPSQFRETLALVLFKHYEVASVLFAPNSCLALLTLGINVGLVVDTGYSEVEVVPVYENIPVLKGLQSLPLGSKAIHRRVEEILKNTAENMDAIDDTLSEDILEDIKARCCFVTSLSRATKINQVTMKGEDESQLPQPSTVGVDYPTNDGKILKVSGKVRELSCEVLFEQDNEETSVTTMILDAIAKCPIDMRRELAENVVIIGGTAMTPGFHNRLCKELYYHLKQPKYQNQLSIKVFKFHKLPGKENYIGWLGGALIGALETLASKSVSKENFLTTRKLPDWCCVGEEEPGEQDRPAVTRTMGLSPN